MAPLYTRRQPSARNSCSSQHRPASEAVSSARAAVPPTDVPAFRAFRRHRSRRVSLLRQAGCAARAASVCRHRQRPDPPQHVAEQPPGQMPFRQQEPVVPGVLHQPAAGFHQPLLETRERPALDPRRQDQSAPEVAQVVTPGRSVAGAPRSPGTDGTTAASSGSPVSVPHPVPWTHICAMPPGVAHTPRAPRSACDTQGFSRRQVWLYRSTKSATATRTASRF